MALEERKAASFLSKIEKVLEHYDESSSPWIFGTKDATALDAHVVPFLCRLLDVGRGQMLEERVHSYAARVFQLPLWKDFMQGKRTVHKAYA